MKLACQLRYVALNFTEYLGSIGTGQVPKAQYEGQGILQLALPIMQVVT